ncbi:MAG: hypothetical protein ACI4JN_07065, partial [Ruminococcus sp.]
SAATTMEETTEEAFIDSDTYKEMVSECVTKISDAGVLLSNVGQYEYKRWSAFEKIGGSRFDYEEAVSDAISWLAEEANVSETVLEDNYNEICSEYNEISALHINESEVSMVKESFDELFKDYNDLYLTVTDLSGDSSDFVDKYNDCIDSIKSNVSYISAITK